MPPLLMGASGLLVPALMITNHLADVPYLGNPHRRHSAAVQRAFQYVIFQLAEVAVSRRLLAAILSRIGQLRLACASGKVRCA